MILAHRPGHHRARPASCSTTTGRSRAAPTASSSSTSRAPAGSSTTPTRSGRSPARSASRRSTTRASTGATWRRSGSPTSARPSSPGTATTGEPLHRALVWQDRRTAARCDELREAGHEPLVRERTGLVLDPYFSGTKIEWLLRNGGVDPGTAAFGTIDSWLVFKLTGAHVTDYSNASRTLLFDIRRAAPGTTSSASCSASRPAALPEPCPSAHVYGETSEFGGEVPVAGIAGDQQAALYGQACHSAGLGKNTYGTGSFVLQNAGGERPAARGGPAHDGRLGGRTDASTTRSRRRSSSPARPSSGCATGSASSRPPPRPRSWRARSTPTTASTSSPRSPASARRTGIPTRAARSSA